MATLCHNRGAGLQDTVSCLAQELTAPYVLIFLSTTRRFSRLLTLLFATSQSPCCPLPVSPFSSASLLASLFSTSHSLLAPFTVKLWRRTSSVVSWFALRASNPRDRTFWTGCWALDLSWTERLARSFLAAFGHVSAKIRSQDPGVQHGESPPLLRRFLRRLL